MYGKKGDDPVSKLFLSLGDFMPYFYEDKADHLLEKYLSFIRTEDSFFFLHQVQSVCVWFFFSVIIRAKMLYIIPDSGI